MVDIAEAGVLPYLFFSMQTLQSGHQANIRCNSVTPQYTGRITALEIMHHLVSNPKIVIEALKKGGLVYFLDMFCSSTNPTVRTASAALLGKILADKLRGPKVGVCCYCIKSDSVSNRPALCCASSSLPYSAMQCEIVPIQVYRCTKVCTRTLALVELDLPHRQPREPRTDME